MEPLEGLTCCRGGAGWREVEQGALLFSSSGSSCNRLTSKCPQPHHHCAVIMLQSYQPGEMCRAIHSSAGVLQARKKEERKNLLKMLETC